MACANDRLYRRLVSEVLERPDLLTDPNFATRKARSANKEKLRQAIAETFKGGRLEGWIAKMKKANVPVGYLRTVQQGFNAPEARARNRLSRIAHPTAGAVPNIEPDPVLREANFTLIDRSAEARTLTIEVSRL